MFYVSEPITTPPTSFKNVLQQKVYATLLILNIPFQRVDTDDAITMEDCIMIDQKLDMKTVKTLFLCNRQETAFYLYITTANKPFSTKYFSNALGVPRVSFASAELLLAKLGVTVGAATIFGVLLDPGNEIQVVIDKVVLCEEWYGCSDGTTTGYMKLATAKVFHDFLSFTQHMPKVIDI